MAKMPYPTEDTMPSASAEYAKKLPDLNIFRMLSHNPAMLKGFVRMGNTLLTKGVLGDQERELFILRTGHHHGATYEIAQHEVIGKAVGLSTQEIDEIADLTQISALFSSPRLRTLIALVDDLQGLGGASEEILQDARKHVGEAEIVEVLLLVGYYALVARFVTTLSIDLEPVDQRGLDL